MNIFVGQIYIEAGVSFPFTIRFQNWISDALADRIPPSQVFSKTFPNYSLGIRLSAKSTILEPELKGPTVFKDTKDVEFTVFLPFDCNKHYTKDDLVQVVRLLLGCCVKIFDDVGLDTANVKKDMLTILGEFLSFPKLLET